METINDERDILNEYYQQLTYELDPSIKDSHLVESLDSRTNVISYNCDLPLRVRSLFIPPNKLNTVPPIICTSQDVQYLTVPSRLIRKIYKINNLRKLRVLIINRGTFKVFNDFILEELELISTSEKLIFKSNNFPNLKAVRCKYDENIVHELIPIKKLSSIAFSCVNADIFHSISNITGLKTLYISSGKLSDIDNIGCLNKLRKLSLMNLSNLTDLYPITSLNELCELQIGYCNHIENWNFLLKLNKLKYLSIPFSSKKYMPPEYVINTLKNNGVQVI